MEDNPNEAARLAVWQAAGELLRAIRLKRGYSRQQLAARAGVSVDLIAAYESGRERFPGIEAWWRLTTALGVGLLTLLKQAELQSAATLRGGVTPHGEAAPPHAPDEDSDLAIFVERLVIEQSLPAELS